MIQNSLKPGDTIGVMAPCSYVERKDIEASKAALEARGYKIFVHPQTYERENQSAGNVLQKSLAFQGLWQRQDVDAIWAAGGGNRGAMLLDSINFDKMAGKQKALIGFSDVTPLLNAVTAHCDLSTIYGPVFKQLHDHANLDEVLSLLEHGAQGDVLPMDDVTVLREGEASGTLYGGCMSPFMLLPQTKDCPDLENAILCLEDIGEELSRVDRMFLHLKRLGVLEQISGLVLGQFLDLSDTGRPFGYSLEDIVIEHCAEYEFPILMNAPFGHGKTLHPIALGMKAEIKTGANNHFFYTPV